MKFISIYLIAFTIHFPFLDIEVNSENSYSPEFEFIPFHDDFGYPRFLAYFSWISIATNPIYISKYDIDF